MSDRQDTRAPFAESNVGFSDYNTFSLPPTRTLPRLDPADLPAAGQPVSWTSANEDYRRERVQREDAGKVRHTHVEWWKGDPTRKEVYPTPKAPADTYYPNKPDYQFDITDIEGARPRSRPGVAHHRCVTSPTTRGFMSASFRESNPVAPYYPWATDVEQRTYPTLPCYSQTFERRQNSTADSHLRYSTGILLKEDIEGTATLPRYSRKAPTDPLDVAGIDGATNSRRHPMSMPRNERPEVHTRYLGRWCYGDSGNFTQHPRTAPQDPNGPDYKYDIRGKEYRHALQDFSGDIKTVPRSWDPLKGSPYELVGKMQTMGMNHATARSRPGRQHAMNRMYTQRPLRTFDTTMPGQTLNAKRYT